MKISIPKQHNAIADKTADNFMEVLSVYPEIQLDHFVFRTIFQEGGILGPNLIVIIATTIKNGEILYHHIFFDKALLCIGDIGIFVTQQKKALEKIFIKEIDTNGNIR